MARQPGGRHALPLVPLPGRLRQVLVQVQAGEVLVLSVAGASWDCARPPAALQAAVQFTYRILSINGVCPE